MARTHRAPPGARKVLSRVANFVRRNGADEAALYLGTSPKRATQILTAIDKKKPLGSIVTSTKGLESWKGKIKEAPQLQKNRAAYESIRDQHISPDRIAEQSGLSRQTVINALSGMQYRTSIPAESKQIRAAVDELKTKLPYYSDQGFIVAPGGEDQAKQIEGAEQGHIFRTGFRDLEDIDTYLDVIFGSAREFFMIIVSTNAQGKTRYSAFDLRPPGVREMPPAFRGLAGFTG